MFLFTLDTPRGGSLNLGVAVLGEAAGSLSLNEHLRFL